jgi:hypothetical protein
MYLRCTVATTVVQEQIFRWDPKHRTKLILRCGPWCIIKFYAAAHSRKDKFCSMAHST